MIEPTYLFWPLLACVLSMLGVSRVVTVSCWVSPFLCPVVVRVGLVRAKRVETVKGFEGASVLIRTDTSRRGLVAFDKLEDSKFLKCDI